jgi:hypothetical protein
MTLANDGFGTLFTTVYSGGGGGGGTVIPNGGDLDGTYSGNVYCEGNVNVISPVLVKGTLYVVGDLIGPDGHSVEVEGDVIAHNWDMTPADITVPQGNITVGGSFYYTNFYWPQCGGSQATFRVAGSVYGTLGGGGSPFTAEAVDNTATNGADIIVYGSWYTGDVYLDGANSDGVLAAGTGGTFDVYGDVAINGGIRLQGGDGQVGFNAAGAGSMYVYGNFTSTGTLDLDGGYGNGSDGGSGGFIDINGYLSSGDVRLAGGWGDLSGGNAGIIYVNGSANVDDFWCSGGSGNAGNGGNGAVIDVDGDIVCDEIEIYGGSGNGGNGGSGGSIYVLGSLTCDEFYAYGESATGGNGGNGAYISVGGNLICDQNFEFFGGSANNGSGGNGGYVSVEGNFTSDYIAGNGGYCNSADETHNAGYGGQINCRNLNVANNTIDLDGGDRLGNTTVANLAGSSSNGGNIYVDGDVICDTMNIRGGAVITDFANRVGGSGGQLFVSGDAIIDNLYANGGTGTGNNGGDGGYISISGRLTCAYLEASGGDSNASLDAAAAINGAASTFVGADGGMFVEDLNCLDGAGAGAVPAFDSNVYLSGTCQFKIVNVVDRPDSKIRPRGPGIPVVFQATSMPAKATLNTWDAGDITASLAADLATSIFTTSSTGAGDWYKHTGVSAM